MGSKVYIQLMATGLLKEQMGHSWLGRGARLQAYELERHQSRESYTNAQLSNENTFTTTLRAFVLM